MTPTYTFRDSGVKPLALRALNFAGQFASRSGDARPTIDAERIRAAASKQAGTDDFGSDSFREPLERYIDALNTDADLTTFGRLTVRGM